VVLDPDGLVHGYDPRLPFLTGDTHARDHTGVYHPNGAVYLRWTASFLRDRSLYKGRVVAYRMPRERSVGTSSPVDLRRAEFRLSERGA
jgi:CMP-N-acetylneuraminic acid synthetase